MHFPGFQAGCKGGEAFSHNGFEALAEARCPGIIKRVHLGDAGNEAWSIAFDDIDGGSRVVAPASQRIGVKAKSFEDRMAVRQREPRQRARHLPVGKAVNGAGPFLPLSGEMQPLDTTIFIVRLFPDVAGQNEFAKHAADAGFLKPKQLAEITRRDARACVDFDQGMHRRGRQVGASEVSAHKTELADKPTRGGADVVYGEGLLRHVKSIMVASCNCNHNLRGLPR